MGETRRASGQQKQAVFVALNPCPTKKSDTQMGKTMREKEGTVLSKFKKKHPRENVKKALKAKNTTRTQETPRSSTPRGEKPVVCD